VTTSDAASAARPAGAGLWDRLAERREGSGPDVWQALADRLDLGRLAPAPTPGVEAARIVGRDGRAYYVLRSPDARYLRLDETDHDLWRRMDGRRTVRQIALEHFQERGQFVAERLARLVGELRANGFLGPAPEDALAAAERRLAERSWRGRLAASAGKALSLELLRVPRADALAHRAYRAVGWPLYTRPARLLWAALIVVGLVVWWRQILLAEHALFKTNGSYTLGLVTLAVLDVAGVALHQAAQALTIARHGRRVNGAGLLLYYGVPVPFVETSDVWMADRRARMAVSWAGPCAMLVLGSALALLAAPLDGTEMGAFLFKGASIWIANAAFNLLPILKLDGYFLLVDYLEMPALRANAVAFVRDGLLGRLRARARLTREERIYALFGIGSAGLIALIPLVVLEARDLRYWDGLEELWSRGDAWSRATALGMGAMFLGPAAFSLLGALAGLVLGIGRAALARWRRRRGAAPPEHVAALAGLPFLRDVPRADLVAIAHHLREEEREPGVVIVRQGARADRFYLVREGTVLVSKRTSDGRDLPLARLGPGDHFGEAALVANVPRTATVTAETGVRLLSLDAGHFRRWLGDHVALGDAVRRSLAERERLAAHALFAGLGHAELDRIAARMLVTRYSAGDEIVRQGEPGDRFYLLVDGRVAVVREHAEAGEASLAELGPGDFFGEMALLATPRASRPSAR
jgi:putative peptide zinc metalloprotease protein